jgi:hypothetical protein
VTLWAGCTGRVGTGKKKALECGKQGVYGFRKVRSYLINIFSVSFRR